MHQGWDLRVDGGCQKFDVFEYFNVAYQIKGDDVWNSVQVKHWPYPHTVGWKVPKTRSFM